MELPLVALSSNSLRDTRPCIGKKRTHGDCGQNIRQSSETLGKAKEDLLVVQLTGSKWCSGPTSKSLLRSARTPDANTYIIVTQPTRPISEMYMLKMNGTYLSLRLGKPLQVRNIWNPRRPARTECKDSKENLTVSVNKSPRSHLLETLTKIPMAARTRAPACFTGKRHEISGCVECRKWTPTRVKLINKVRLRARKLGQHRVTNEV